MAAASDAEAVAAAPAPAGASPAASSTEARQKRINLLGFQVEASESKAKKALVGATAFLVVMNGLGLPFVLPKMRRFLGAPYVPMKRHVVQVLFDRVLPTWAASRQAAGASSGAGSLTGLRLVDFGSGDGRIVAAAAASGMHAVGYELNPYLYFWSQLRSRSTIASAPGSGELRWANAWSADLRDVDIVTVYGRPGDAFMEQTAVKLEQELPSHAAVVSHFFDIPGWERFLVQDVEGLKVYDLSLRSLRPGAAETSSRGEIGRAHV
eukprot:TRINITY_DN15094_c0_g1_i1.p1 TRINITY_DN15094_c0_g1~~TRINITY_DN15094_c0_g1_i1.p1  ORF type:complete len:288 (+),score=51.98 TRINITY_DN15094_c0_g1_i1:68-865(+)